MTTRYAVKCPRYTTESRPTRESAEKLRGEIEAMGCCEEQHEVVPVEKPKKGKR